jgi:hypothetical protein
MQIRAADPRQPRADYFILKKRRVSVDPAHSLNPFLKHFAVVDERNLSARSVPFHRFTVQLGNLSGFAIHVINFLFHFFIPLSFCVFIIAHFFPVVKYFLKVFSKNFWKEKRGLAPS